MFGCPGYVKCSSHKMGLSKHYLRFGQSARDRLFGISSNVQNGVTSPHHGRDRTPIQMLVSRQGRIKWGRLVVIMFGLLALAIGIVLSSIPWLDYLIIKNLRLWNNTLSYHYWQKPGVLRLTKVFIFNVTNPEGFLSGEKPRLNEIGPFTYREDMQKVNVKFHDNGTVTYQHKKILVFMPELSVDKELKIVVPNVPLLTLTSMSSEYNYMLRMGLSMFIKMTRMHPFKMITAEELVFGYDDTLTSIANTYYPRGKRPPKKMGLLLGRNGTLEEVSTIFTGHTDMKEFGLINRLNGQDKLPFWQSDPCNSIRASEGSLFPPRDITKSDVVHVYDKDLCRVWPLRHRHDTEKDGIKAGYYTPDDAMFDNSDNHTANKCFCPGVDKCPPNGLQNISPCQYDAPIYVSFPHFYKADASLLDAVEGLKPDQEKHETYFKINPKMGVTLEAKVRVQMNLKVEKANINPVQNFRSIIFPVMWLEEGVSDLTPTIHRWVYLSTTVADRLGPSINYSLILTGIIILVTSFIRAYKDLVFTTENIEMGKRQIRRGSNFIVNGGHGQHKIMIIRDSYALLHNNSSAETAFCPEQEAL
ncbi:hypothetical protein LSTR_LSTR008966 [Laodelphax striatellus]|uniref:Scavenger receptor class B member 1 n=1 Tax=Laodelphax striatellus TaxID=195883 RepID=A0A482WK34_LAOST|nr:hypothetical protein LSTR_LSTR008966 [Laodelphax striatellus]